MAKTSSKHSTEAPASQRLTPDPFNAILGAFFLVIAVVLPVAIPAPNGRLSVLHVIGMAVLGLLGVFFLWRWSRAQLAYALHDETHAEVARVRAATFSQDTPSDKTST